MYLTKNDNLINYVILLLEKNNSQQIIYDKFFITNQIRQKY